MNIDIERLREDLREYFGSAIFNASSIAIMELIEVCKCSDEEIIEIARKNGFNLNNYRNDFKNNYFKSKSV